MDQTKIDKALRLTKLAKLHSQCSFDLELEIQHTIIQCDDIDYLLEHLTPILNSSIQEFQAFRLQLRAIQRKIHQNRPNLPKISH